MKDIIIFGPCGAGKTTLADMIVSELKDKKVYAERHSLGSKIKAISKMLGRENRETYQKVGQLFVREFNKSIWCECLVKEVGELPMGTVIVIDDGRQHHEHDYFCKGDMGLAKFLSIGIISDTMTRIQRIFDRDGVMTTREQLSHDTENQAKEVFEKCDIRIYNNATLDELREEAKKIIKILEESK